ncbi:hypothetical protein Bbelb_278630 [Branchiostoma belcheri]|nr:hypothetical protein Bbelb_278630 [Branchiostoma belcheri]
MCWASPNLKLSTDGDVTKCEGRMFHSPTVLGKKLARSEWRHAVKVGLARGQVKHHMQLETKRQKRKEKLHAQNSSSFLCLNCGRDCHARIGLISHTKRCPRPQHQT